VLEGREDGAGSGAPEAGARVAEAKRLGFIRAIVPKDNLKTIGSVEGLEVVPVSNLDEVFVRAHLQ